MKQMKGRENSPNWSFLFWEMRKVVLDVFQYQDTLSSVAGQHPKIQDRNTTDQELKQRVIHRLNQWTTVTISCIKNPLNYEFKVIITIAYNFLLNSNVLS